MQREWDYRPLSEVAIIKSGYTPSTADLYDAGDYPYFKVGDMNKEGNEQYLQHSDSYVKTPCRFFPRGAIVFPKNGAAIGTNKKRILKQDSVVDLNTAVLIPSDVSTSEFLYYWISQIDFRTMTRRGAVPTLDMQKLKALLVPSLSLKEQNHIVAELDLVSGLIEKQKEQLKELDTLAQSLFYKIFGNPVENDMGWKTDSLSVVAPQKAFGGTIPSIEGKYWLLNLDMVEQQTGRILERVLFHASEIGNSTTTFDSSNVLYSKLRPYLNKVVVPDSIGYATSELITLRPDSRILDRVFLAYLLRSKAFVDYISVKVAGAKMPRVSMDVLRAFPVILPPLSLQQSFAARIDAIEHQRTLINQSLVETKTLFDYTLNKYFG